MIKLKKISLVAGARPNFMKIAPIVRALTKYEDVFSWQLVHTGQHYDHEMSDVFFDELGIPNPDFYLDAGGGSHAEQTAKIMVAYEKVCLESSPDLVLVVGDVNSTLACSIVAKKLGIKVAHVEAGLRSGDKRMPEEINRLVTDAISDMFFVTEESGVSNLLKEAHPESSVHFVGHVMIDNLFYQLKRLKEVDVSKFKSNSAKHELSKYGVVTLHRPSNVDCEETLYGIVSALNEISEKLPLLFPVHPRTMASLKKRGIRLGDRIVTTGPLPYMEFLNLWKDAVVVITDSGGLQEESTALAVPCVTIRDNTERPITISQGTNILAGTDPKRIVETSLRAIDDATGVIGRSQCPAFWDGHAAERIVDILRHEICDDVS